MFLKEFEVRWSDVDANRHLGNSAYLNFMSHTRMSFLDSLGFSMTQMEEYGIGPVVFYEHLYYFREILPGKPVRVSLEMAGLSEDGTYFEFHHNFYDPAGKNLAHCEMMGGWIQLGSRKLHPLPTPLMALLQEGERSPEFRWLSKEDTRRYGKMPRNLV